MKALKPILTIALMLISFVCFVFGWFIQIDLGDEWDSGLGIISETLGEIETMTEDLEYEIETYEETDREDLKDLDDYTRAAVKLKEHAKKMMDFVETIQSGTVSLWDMHRVTMSISKIFDWYEDAFEYEDDEDFQNVKLAINIVKWIFIVIPLFGLFELVRSTIKIFMNKEKAANNFRRHTIAVFIPALLMSTLPYISEDFRDSDMRIFIGIPYVIMLVTGIAAAIVWNSMTKKEKGETNEEAVQ